jgi:hypothetical protein
MKTKLVLMIMLVTLLACSSKYDESKNESMPYDETVTEMEEPAYETEKSEELYNEQLAVATSEQERTRKATTSNKTGNFRNPLEYLADTLYLNSVRLSKKIYKNG